jgi:nucleoside-diphosphate-sugar epimerase
MKILVIGGSGFIGTRLVDELLKTGHDLSIFDKNPSPTFNHLVTIGDVRDQDQNALDKALHGIDVVYNLAAEHRDDVTPTSLYYDVNVQGAKNIVKAAELNNAKKIIFTSTVAVYGLNKPDPDEKSPTDPFNDYGKSKLQAERVFADWADKGSERSLTIVRPVVIFGENNKGNVFNLISQIAGNKFMMVGQGKNSKSMGYIGNIVEFLIRALDFGSGIHLFNYADKPDMPVKELVETVRSELGIADKPLMKLPYSIGMVGGYTFDVLSRITGKKFPISSIRIKKFCATTSVSTHALDDDCHNIVDTFSCHDIVDSHQFCSAGITTCN